MSKIYTCRFIFKDDFEYKDLAPVFPDIMKHILMMNGHFQNTEQGKDEDKAKDEEMREMFIDLNMQDILANRKPEGYDRVGKYRLIFPIGVKEFYIKQFAQKQTEMKHIGITIGDFLSAANIAYELKYDYTVDCIPGSEGTFALIDHNTEVTFPETYEFGKVIRATFKIKKPKKNAKFGYIVNGEFRQITIENNTASMNIEVVDDIKFGYQ